MPRCSIIIPAYNKASLTRQCLDSLLSHPPLAGDFEIIVVDDASTDITQQLLASSGDCIRTLTHTANTGFGSACNDGAAVSSSEYLVLLNNDTIPQAGWLDALVKYADSHPQAAAVGSKLLFPNNTIQHAGVAICQDLYPRHIYAGFPADHPAVNKSRRFQIVTAGCVLIRRELFEQLGGFDPAYRSGYEDVDLCLRLGVQGYEVHYCHESVLYHLESVSREGRDSEAKSNFELYKTRWVHRVQPDDFSYYIEDGLLEINYWDLYPICFTPSPLLAIAPGVERERKADQLLKVYSRQVFDLMKENVRLNLRAQEAELQVCSFDKSNSPQLVTNPPQSLSAQECPPEESNQLASRFVSFRQPSTPDRESMPICIAGVHRSGTSMVTKLLHMCGLYLGQEHHLMPPTSHNADGYWENMRFVEVNEEILQTLGGRWDDPPQVPDQWDEEKFDRLRLTAKAILREFWGQKSWGWKDPRNSLTLTFWKGLLPNLRVIICVRNPIEVARSLQERESSSLETGFDLWLSYYKQILRTTSPEERIVTDYSSYFHDARRELRRVLKLLGMNVPSEVIDEACTAVMDSLRHHTATAEELIRPEIPAEIEKLYAELCAEAGPVYEASLGKNGGDALWRLDEKDRIVHARDETIARLEAELSASRDESRQAADLNESLKAQVDESENVITARDEALVLIEDELAVSGEKNWVLSAQLSAKTREVDQITHSLGWRLLTRYGPLKYRYLLPAYRMLGLPPYSRTAREK